MGWLDNLDNDLNDDQPGPSGLSNAGTSVTMVEEFSNSENAPNQGDDESEQDAKAKPPTPFELFIDKVTIAGLKETVEGEFRSIKYMFRIAMVLFFIMIIYQSIKIADQYMNQSSILDTFNVINERAPFPNISVCYPFFFNSTESLFMSSSILSISKRSRAIGDYHHFTDIDAVNSIRQMIKMDVSTDNLATPLYLFSRTVYDQLLHEYNEKGQDPWFELAVPDCTSVLSECNINGQQFDCCIMAIPMSIGLSICYQIDMSKIIRQKGIYAADETRVEMNVKTDWEYGVFDTDNSASDGYHIFINTVPIQTMIPASVPAGMDGTIVLGEPEKLSQIQDCLSNENAQELKYFDYYDSQGVQCIWDSSLSMQLRWIGCMLPTASYFPFNQTCTYAQVTQMSWIATTATTVDDVISMVSSEFTNKDALEQLKTSIMQEKNHFADIVARRSSSCQPLCSRWEYPVLSVSYAKTEYRDDEAAEYGSKNISWSRLRIILPYSSSIDRQEKKIFSASYMSMCDIGGMMGVWLGFSVITIIQLFVYGGYIIISIDVRSIWHKLCMFRKGDKPPETAFRLIDRSKANHRPRSSGPEGEINKGSNDIPMEHLKSVDKEKAELKPRRSRIPVLVKR